MSSLLPPSIPKKKGWQQGWTYATATKCFFGVFMLFHFSPRAEHRAAKSQVSGCLPGSNWWRHGNTIMSPPITSTSAQWGNARVTTPGDSHNPGCVTIAFFWHSSCDCSNTTPKCPEEQKLLHYFAPCQESQLSFCC